MNVGKWKLFCLALAVAALAPALQHRQDTSDFLMTESEMLNTEGTVACVPMHLRGYEACAIGQVAPCPTMWGCTAYTCRDVCSAWTSYCSIALGLPNYSGYLSWTTCAAVGSTYNVRDCVGVRWCSCTGVVYTTGWPCPVGNNPNRRFPC